jgi:6-pyruvoyltetrahydropterin/6-carboxytetrahydropterin synthase
MQGVVGHRAPIVELSRRFTFSAAHRLHSKALSDAENAAVFGKCNHANGHGHNYAVELYFRGPVVRETGMVVNITDVKKEVAKLEAILDHKNIDRDVLYFDTVVSSAENIAVFIWEQIKAGPLGHLVSKVEVWETEVRWFVIGTRVLTRYTEQQVHLSRRVCVNCDNPRFETLLAMKTSRFI